MTNKTKRQKVLILNNIRSVLNAGAIFRTADAIGINKIYLTGYTPAPVDRFGRNRSDFSKSALGAEKIISWDKEDSAIDLIKKLKQDDFIILSLEQDEKSFDYKKIENKIKNKNIAIVLGNEVDGVDDEILKESDFIVEIPMKGEKESLNVSVATGVLLYRLFDN